MTLGDFIDGYLIPKQAGTDGGAASAAPSDTAAGEESGSAAATGGPARARGYLAQHALFDQIPALRRDITVPDYCVLGEDGKDRESRALRSQPTITTEYHITVLLLCHTCILQWTVLN